MLHYNQSTKRKPLAKGFSDKHTRERGPCIMNSQVVIMGAVLVVIIALFLSEKLPLAVTSLVGAVVVGLLGFVPHKEVFTSFASTSMILMISMMIVGSSLFYTGLAQKIGNVLYKFTGGSERSMILIAVLSGTLLSSVCSGTATLVTLFPIITSLCITAKVSVSKTYLPLAYGICFGSMLTVAASGMGTASSGLLEDAGFRAWGFLEPAYVGVPLAVVGVVVLMIFGTKMLPDNKVESQMSEAAEDTSAKSPVKMWISGIVLIAIFVMMVISPKKLPLYMISSAGVVVLLVTGTITQKQMFDSISWSSVFLIAGMTTVANGVSNSGLGEVIAGKILSLCGSNSSPLLIIAVLLLVTAALTQFLSNNASILIMAPIGIALAKQMGIEPYAFVMATFVGCLSCFCTPMATPALAYVMEPGRYRYKDFLKAGFMMQIVYFAVGMVVIPLVWL